MGAMTPRIEWLDDPAQLVVLFPRGKGHSHEREDKAYALLPAPRAYLVGTSDKKTADEQHGDN
jgi:hypothetical protein